MKKYNIEGGLDFFDELYKSLDIEDNKYKTENDNNLCLITNEVLTDKFVEMSCGHKFNYIPLYKDILNHKSKFNSLESSSSKLNKNEIRCPYCRKKQNNVLPYYSELGLDKIDGVNYFDVNNIKNIKTCGNTIKKCEFLIQPENIDLTLNNNSVIFCKCSFFGSVISNDQKPDETFNDNKYYCWKHKKEVIKNYKKEKQMKLKEETKKAKEEAKEEAKKAKEEEKEEAKKAKEELKKSILEAKLNKKVTKTNNIGDENTILSISDENINTDVCISTNLTCSAILKTGLNKGKSCGCKIFTNNMCKRHYSIENKL
jgi:hypothetical protein